MTATADLLCMGEPMLEFNQPPAARMGSRLYLEGFGGDTSNAAVAAARQGASVGYITAMGRDRPGDSFIGAVAAGGRSTQHGRPASEPCLTGSIFRHP